MRPSDSFSAVHALAVGGLSFVESRLVYIGDQVKLLGRGFNTNGEFLDLVLLISVGFIVPNRVIRAMTVGIR